MCNISGYATIMNIDFTYRFELDFGPFIEFSGYITT
jgi:hypothetical protein